MKQYASISLSILLLFLTSCTSELNSDTSTVSWETKELTQQEYRASDFTWIITDTDTPSEFGEPHQKVTLKVWNSASEAYEVWEFPMNCNVSDSSTYTGSQKISQSVNCWWAWAGKEIGVFFEDDNYVVKFADISESNEDEQSQAVQFTTLFSLKN